VSKEKNWGCLSFGQKFGQIVEENNLWAVLNLIQVLDRVKCARKFGKLLPCQWGVGDLGMWTCQLGLDNWAVWTSTFWQSRLGNLVRSIW